MAELTMDTSSVANSSSKMILTRSKMAQLSVVLADEMLADGFHPTLMISLWRGGAPIALDIQEYMQRLLSYKIDSVPIYTESRNNETGEQISREVIVHAYEYACSRMTPETKLVIVDDVFDSGRTMQAVIKLLRDQAGARFPTQMKIATVFDKPAKHAPEVTVKPDYTVATTDAWIVFPHEFAGLTAKQIALRDPHLARVAEILATPE